MKELALALMGVGGFAAIVFAYLVGAFLLSDWLDPGDKDTQSLVVGLLWIPLCFSLGLILYFI